MEWKANKSLFRTKNMNDTHECVNKESNRILEFIVQNMCERNQTEEREKEEE